MDHWRNKKGSKWIPGDEWKWKQNIQKLCGTEKAVLRGKFRVIQTDLRKQEKSQINSLTLYLKELEKEDQTKCKVSKRKEIIKIRAETNEIETKNQQ